MKNNLSDSGLNQSKQCTIYFDGACPLCSKEIATYKQWRGAEKIEWIDASQCSEQALGTDLERAQALGKLHVRDADGHLTSGVAAFIELWKHLPAMSWLTPFLSQPWITRCLDQGYLLFLKIRPLWRKPAITSKHTI